MSLNAPIPAYLYQQYARDPDLPYFVGAYNAAAQYYLDWFNATPLGLYPGLTGDLLDWAVEGIFGPQRMALASPASPSIGPFETLAFAQDPLETYQPPPETLYALTDDAFKRILTWNYYKGDGNRFNMRWLKRRVMRFLLGANGLDPQPSQPGFVIGCENTLPISATVASSVLTVNIDQATLSKYAQIDPGVLQIFQLAFQAGQTGPLELPLQYDSYICNIVTVLSATATPNTFVLAGTATTQTTANTSVAVLAGSGSYTYAWSAISGGAGITIGSASAATTDFAATGMAPGNTYSGVFQCLVTDTVTTDTTTCRVSVSIQCYAALSASISPSAASVTNATATETTNSVTASISGGSGSYSVAWTFSAGGASITINSPGAPTTSFTTSGLTPGQTLSGTALCTVTDLVTGLQVFPTCPVSIVRVTSVSASVSPTSLSSSGASTTQTTGSATVSASGGSGSYSYSCAWISGGSGLSIGSPSSASSTFTGAGMTPGDTYSGIARFTVTDGYGQTAYADVSVSITCTAISTGSYSGSLTVGNDGANFGYSTVAGDSFGAISPTTDSNGNSIVVIYNFESGEGGRNTLTLSIAGASVYSYFTTLTVPGVGSFSSSTASFTSSGGVGTWIWNNGTTIVSGTWSYS